MKNQNETSVENALEKGQMQGVAAVATGSNPVPESANDTASYAVAVADHTWCIDRNIVARVRFSAGKWFCEYTTARVPGWLPFRSPADGIHA